MSTFEEEIRDKKFQAATGTARRFKSIDGVGQKTADKVRGTFLGGGKGRIEAPKDVQDLTDDELAEKADISQNRARKVIRGAGGNPDRDETRSSTGSVSAAGIEMPHGEFVTEVSDHDKAEAKFSTSLNRGIGRSQNAAIADKGKRAPVTTDFERWKKNKGELDFPGVDTPTDDPQVLPKDLRQEQRPDTTDPDTADVTPAGSVPDTSEPFELDLGRRDVSLGPKEAAGEKMTDSATTTRLNPDSGMNAGLASGQEADMAFIDAEEERGSSDNVVGDLVQSGSVPTRPYESRNDGPPSQVGPYELTQDRQNDDLRTVAFENEESDRSVVFQTYNTDLDGPEATVDVSFGDNIETVAEGDADEVYQQFIGELEERRDRNKEREPSDGSGIQGRVGERMSAAQQLFGGGQ